MTLTRRFVLLTALRWTPVGLWVPFSVLIMRERGLSLTAIGLLWSVYSVTVALLELPTGGLADTIGRRSVLVLGTLLSGAMFTLMLFARDLPTLMVAFVLYGIERALRSGPLEAWYVDTARRAGEGDRLRRGLSGAGVAEAGALGVGGLVAGFLPRLAPGLPEGAAAPLSQLTLPLVVAVGVELALVVALFAWVDEDRVRHRGALRRAVREAPAVVRSGLALGARDPGLRLLLLGVAAVGFAMVAVELLWQPRLAELLGGADRTELFGAASALAFLAAAAGAALAPRFGGDAGRGAAAATLAHGVLLAGLAAAGSLAGAGVAYGIVYLAQGLAWPLRQELLHERVTEAQRATMLSALSLALMTGGLVGNLSLTSLAERTGIPVTWAVAAAVAGLSAILYLRIPRIGHGPAVVNNADDERAHV
jgi:hypothetical protein